MFSWWPKHVSTGWIAPLRTLGKKNVRYGELFYDEKGAHRDLIWDGKLSLSETVCMKVLYNSLLMCLSRMMVDGPKLFVVPKQIEAALNDIEITLAVKDFHPPFPACVIQHPNGEYHYFVFDNQTLFICTFLADGCCDYIGMLLPDEIVESYFTGYKNTKYDEFGKVSNGVDAAFVRHRFKATLNFLLLATMQGIISRGHLAKPRLVRNNPELKAINPEIYEPQNIKLFCEKSISATATPEGCGSSGGKRPHWRRAHYRHVPCGPKRAQRKLVLIPHLFINRKKLADDGARADATYLAR